MKSLGFHVSVQCLIALCFGFLHPSNAQAPDGSDGVAVIGMTGCASDVAVAASRTRIVFSSDGEDVPALLYEPQGVTRRGAALVLLHGQDVERDVAVLDNHAIQLASQGFAVILPFYLQVERPRNGSSESRSTHRVWRKVGLDAAEAIAVEMALDSNKVVLWGNGRGGGVALAATLQPGSPAGGAISINIGGVPQDDAQGSGRPFLLIHSGHNTVLLTRMADEISKVGGLVERLELASAYGHFKQDDWCRVMDGTRGILERVEASGSSNVLEN